MTEILIIFLTGFAIAISAAFLGVFVVLKRMALVSDALSHVALPGLAAGIILGFNPFWGALAALILAVFLIFFIEEKTKLATETVVGIIFTAALAIGTLIIPSEELIESLFGSLEDITLFNFWLAIGGSIVASVLLFIFFPQLARASISRDLLQAEGVAAVRFHILYLGLLAFILALGIKIVGSLLMGALIILPAATAKNFSRSLKVLVLYALGVALVSVAVGIFISLKFAIPPGPAIILVNVVLFLLSLIPARR